MSYDVDMRICGQFIFYMKLEGSTTFLLLETARVHVFILPSYCVSVSLYKHLSLCQPSNYIERKFNSLTMKMSESTNYNYPLHPLEKGTFIFFHFFKMILNDMILTLVTYSLTDPNVLFLELLSQPENSET